MKHIKVISFTLLAIYFFMAFIKWNLFWLSEIPLWTIGERAASFFVLLLIIFYSYFIYYKIID